MSVDESRQVQLTKLAFQPYPVGKVPSVLQVYHHAGIALAMWGSSVTQGSWIAWVVCLNSFIHTIMLVTLPRIAHISSHLTSSFYTPSRHQIVILKPYNCSLYPSPLAPLAPPPTTPHLPSRYTYFLLSTLGIKVPGAKYLTSAQIIQFFTGIFGTIGVQVHSKPYISRICRLSQITCCCW